MRCRDICLGIERHSRTAGWRAQTTFGAGRTLRVTLPAVLMSRQATSHRGLGRPAQLLCRRRGGGVS